MKKLLVLCDFSQPSMDAFDFALDMRMQSGGNIFLLNVVELSAAHATYSVPSPESNLASFAGFSASSENEFAKLKKSYAARAADFTTVIEFGTIEEKFLACCQENHFDLVLMGSHGVSGFRQPFFGSNVTKIVRASEVPVMVVKNHVNKPVRNIVFPNNLELTGQDDLIAHVKEMQNFFKAKLHVVWINTESEFSSSEVAHKKLDEFASHAELTNFTLNVSDQYTDEGGIVSFSESIGGDIIAMGTHGRKGLNHWLNGSITEDIANHSQFLVWSYRMNNSINLSEPRLELWN